jgi:hypothetical protein
VAVAGGDLRGLARGPTTSVLVSPQGLRRCGLRVASRVRGAAVAARDLGAGAAQRADLLLGGSRHMLNLLLSQWRGCRGLATVVGEISRAGLTDRWCCPDAESLGTTRVLPWRVYPGAMALLRELDRGWCSRSVPGVPRFFWRPPSGDGPSFSAHRLAE